MPKTKEQNEAIRAEKRLLILDAALQLFAKNGYASTSIDKIAKRAGISKGLMYNYFESKEELLFTIINGLMVEFFDAIDPDHDGFVTDEEADGFIDKMFEILIHRKSEMKLYYQLSFQPQVLDALIHRFDVGKALETHRLVVQYFGKQLPCPDEKMAELTVISFLKGAFMVCAFANYPDDFMMNYKAYLKQILLKKQ
jgi:AcrR family transcriptional regulator